MMERPNIETMKIDLKESCYQHEESGAHLEECIAYIEQLEAENKTLEARCWDLANAWVKEVNGLKAELKNFKAHQGVLIETGVGDEPSN